MRDETQPGIPTRSQQGPLGPCGDQFLNRDRMGPRAAGNAPPMLRDDVSQEDL